MKLSMAYKLIGIITVYRITIIIIEQLAYKIIPIRYGFLGYVPSANFDGMHYISIAQNGYFQYEQAFFPLFPILIKLLGISFPLEISMIALVVVNSLLFTSILLFYRLAKLEVGRKKALVATFFFLSFPSTFFLTAVYTEGLFLTLILGSFLLLKKGNFFTASIIAAFASATRLVGIFMAPVILFGAIKSGKELSKKRLGKVFSFGLISTLGLIGYITYLYKTYGDPVLFVTSQPAFGAGRSGGEIILLPQVIYRYIKIFITADGKTLTYWVSVFEFLAFFIVLFLLYKAFKSGINKSYIIFSLFAIIIPTMSGTLSSIPRYSLVAFPIFLYLAKIKSARFKISIIILFAITEMVISGLFFAGYFVS